MWLAGNLYPSPSAIDITSSLVSGSPTYFDNGGAVDRPTDMEKGTLEPFIEQPTRASLASEGRMGVTPRILHLPPAAARILARHRFGNVAYATSRHPGRLLWTGAINAQ